MKNKILICICLFVATIYTTKAQVKIGNNPNTINANSLLELESTTKGFLAPRVAINDLNSVSPLTATTPAGMLVYSSGGTVADGFYNWNGSMWVKLTNSSDLKNTVTKTTDATLLKSDAIVLASNDITLTLPTVTSADDGLTITVKNVGTYTDLITIVPEAGKKIDANTSSSLTRWKGRTYIANGGNWLIKEKEAQPDNVLDVDEIGSFKTIAEAIAFLNLHMEESMIVRLCSGSFEIDATQTINLPYPVTFEGASFGASEINATAGISGSPMFICQTECYFKMLTFNAFSNVVGNDAIHFTGSGIYGEVKDSYFYGFNKGIVTTSNTDLWIFEADFDNHTGVGVEIAAGTASGGSLKLSECDFTMCKKGVNLLSGVNETVSILNCTFYNTVSGTDIGINYESANFTSFASMFISNNAWNNQGSFFSGFDFTRSDGRDANAFLIGNSGYEDKKPYCKINVNNNALTTTLASNALWYHANFLNSAGSITCKWKLEDNKITYLPNNGSGAWAVISGNISVSNANRVITIAICKNGSTLVRYGETDLRVTVANQPFQFSTVIYVPDLVKTDYLEIAVKTANSGDVVTFQDVQWYTNAK
jgi:hypothetical protein